MITFVGQGPEFLPIAYRLNLMGRACVVYVHDPVYHRAYQHLLNHCSAGRLRDASIASDLVVVDNTTLGHEAGVVLGPKIVGMGISPDTSSPPRQDFVTGWWTGKRFAFFTRVYQEHGVLAGNVGPLAGGSHAGALMPIEHDDLLNDYADTLRAEQYVGPVSRLGDDYYLGMAWDSVYATLSLVQGPRDQFWLKRFNVALYPGIVCWVRVSVPPYPFRITAVFEQLTKPIHCRLSDHPYWWAQDIMLTTEGLKCAACDGLLGVVTASGATASKAVASMRRNLRKLQAVTGDLNFRDDYKDVVGRLNHA